MGGEEEQSSSISRFLGNSGALSALNQIVHKSSSLQRLFHSVIFNSVIIYNKIKNWETKNTVKYFLFCYIQFFLKILL